jgi:hypothetical protein
MLFALFTLKNRTVPVLDILKPLLPTQSFIALRDSQIIPVVLYRYLKHMGGIGMYFIFWHCTDKRYSNYLPGTGTGI